MSTPSPAPQDEIYTQLFGSMIIQYTNMALMFMGQAPHPETGELVKDLQAAQMFIGQLEMLQAKTRGNLTPKEESLLKQGLTSTRLAFVECIEREDRQPAVGDTGANASATPPAEATSPTANDPGAPASETDGRKKFVKKY